MSLLLPLNSCVQRRFLRWLVRRRHGGLSQVSQREARVGNSTPYPEQLRTMLVVEARSFRLVSLDWGGEEKKKNHVCRAARVISTSVHFFVFFFLSRSLSHPFSLSSRREYRKKRKTLFASLFLFQPLLFYRKARAKKQIRVWPLRGEVCTPACLPRLCIRKRKKAKKRETQIKKSLSLPSLPTTTTTTTTMPVTISDADHSRWRAGAPLLYDWLSNQSLLWPSLSCRCVFVFVFCFFSSFFFWRFVSIDVGARSTR